MKNNNLSMPTYSSWNYLLQLRPAPWDWGRCLRAMLCVGLPFGIGIYTANIMPWMWIAMGTLMMTTGEQASLAYKSRAVNLLVIAIFGACGYLLGYLSHLPYGFTIVVMAVVGIFASLLSQKGSMWSIGFLQLLLTASIAIGVPGASPFWWPALLYIVGALAYLVILGLEAVLMAKHSQNASVIDKTSHVVVDYSLINASVLAISLAVAYSAYYFISSAHWFWVPLTVSLIIKPDLGNIFQRSVLRSLGTILGVIIATIVLVLIPKNISLALIIAVLSGLLPWCMARSYGLQAIVLTPLVLFLVDSISLDATNINYSLQRLGDTIIGAIIVIVIGHLILLIARNKTET